MKKIFFFFVLCFCLVLLFLIFTLKQKTETIVSLVSKTEQPLILLFQIDPTKVEFDFVEKLPGQDISSWSQEFTDALFVINGFYFQEDLKPSGLVLDDGKRLGHKTFEEHLSGFIQLKPKFEIFDTEDIPLKTIQATDGGQTFPFLIKNGDVAVEKDSGLLARRSFLGQDTQGIVYVGIVPQDPVSLFTLSQRLATMDIDWKHVINLDGGPSSGLVVQTESEQKTFPNYISVPNVIMAFRKK